MDEARSQDIRIGDAEREDGVRALGEHFSAGRLDVDEYGERTAKATTARTRRELGALFADLPDPHPRFERLAPAKVTAPDPAAASPLTPWWRQGARAALLAVAVVGTLGIAAVAVSPLAKAVLVFPVILFLVFGRIGRRPHDRRRDRRDRRL